jgi:hypothetical protein
MNQGFGDSRIAFLFILLGFVGAIHESPLQIFYLLPPAIRESPLHLFQHFFIFYSFIYSPGDLKPGKEIVTG